VIRSANWQLEMREVDAYTQDGNAGKLKVHDYGAGMDLGGYSWGYYLVNKKEELNVPGEWYYDPLDNRLYVRSLQAGQPPQDIEATVHDYGFKPVNCMGTTVENLQFSHYRVAGMYMYDSTPSFGLTIDG